MNYNGGITTSHTLWAGVPVLTVPGKNYVSRMSYSLLSAVGLGEMAVESWDDYEKRAIYLATHPTQLEDIRKTLATNKESFPLFDTQRACRNIERTYQLIWERYVNNEGPTLLRVNEN